LLSNLRPITRDVHLITRGQFLSRDKDSDHTIRSVIPETPMLRANFMALFFIKTGVIADRSFTLWEWGFFMFLLMWPWPWLDDLHIWTLPVLPGNIPNAQMHKYELATSRLSRVLSIDRQTDTTEIIYHAASRVVTNRSISWLSLLVMQITRLLCICHASYLTVLWGSFAYFC